MRSAFALAALGLALVALGGWMILIQWHRTYGLGSLGLGSILLVSGLIMAAKSKAGEGGRSQSPKLIRRRLPTRALIGLAIIFFVGTVAFYGTMYLTELQASVPPSGNGNTSSQSRSSTSAAISQNTSSSNVSSGPTTGCSQNRGIGGAPNPLRLDGSAINYTGSGTSSSVSISTQNSSDVVIVIVTAMDNPPASGSAPPAVKDVAGGKGTLTFLKRGSIDTMNVNAGSDRYSVEEWYAVTTSSLVNATITVQLDGASPEITVIAFGVSGANVTSPFDPNQTVPATAAGSGAGNVGVSICTDHPNDMIIGGAVMSSMSPGAGYNLIQRHDAKSTGQSPIAEYRQVTTPQKDFYVFFTWQEAALLQTWAVIGDAIQSASTCSALGQCT